MRSVDEFEKLIEQAYATESQKDLEALANWFLQYNNYDYGGEFYNIDGTLLCNNRYNIGEFAPRIDAVTGRADYVGAEGRTTPGSNQLLGVLINAKGVALVADHIGLIYDNKLAFEKDKLWGVWDAADDAGKELIAPTYDELRFIGKDTILVQKDGAVWVQKLDGTVVIDKGYEALAYEERFVNGAPQPRRALMAKKDGKWGLVDHEGKILVPMQYDAIPGCLSANALLKVVFPALGLPNMFTIIPSPPAAPLP